LAQRLRGGRDSLIGLDHYEVNTDLPERWKKVHRDALSGHFLRNDNDYWEESAEGPRWVRWAAYPWFDAAGGIGGIIISADDFTAVQISEQQLVESGRRYRELVEALPVALYTTDAEGVITLFNSAAVALWGRSPQLGVERWCGSMKILGTDGVQIEHHQCPMATALQENRTIWGVELQIERPDGALVPVLAHPTPLYDSEGKIAGGLNVLVDISEQKRAEEALREADRRKDEFLAMLAHELRNPLTPIRNAADLMASLNLDDPRLQWIQGSLQRVTALAHLLPRRQLTADDLAEIIDARHRRRRQAKESHVRRSAVALE
jgi:PAS domain S-box-containing protein